MVKLILERKLFPCFFGSALKMEGVDAFIHGMETYMAAPVCPSEFGAKIFKIARDDQGNRLTYMKITGGSLNVLNDTVMSTSLYYKIFNLFNPFL